MHLSLRLGLVSALAFAASNGCLCCCSCLLIHCLDGCSTACDFKGCCLAYVRWFFSMLNPLYAFCVCAAFLLLFAGYSPSDRSANAGHCGSGFACLVPCCVLRVVRLIYKAWLCAVSAWENKPKQDIDEKPRKNMKVMYANFITHFSSA